MVRQPIIASVRLGHANNSSSTHSLLVGSRAEEILDCRWGRYGWGWFHLRDPKWKANYLSTLIFTSLVEDESSPMDPEVARLVALKVTGDDPCSGVDLSGGPPYVDHQSVPKGLPRQYGKKYPNLDFLRDLSRYVIGSPEVTIRGGNDNEPPPIDFGGAPCAASRSGYLAWGWEGKGMVCRKDGDWWTVYNELTGAKIRLAFERNPGPHVPQTPELVDLKITDRCYRGCDFCYQGSSPEGRHADLKQVRRILSGLGKAQVFEVALGGGEPTEHPGFPDILEDARACGITPNFSTGVMSWTRRDDIRKAVIRHCGSFALSNPDCLRDLIAWNAEAEPAQVKERRYPSGSFQIPLGCLGREEILEVIQAARIFDFRVTFLGYKRAGRAKNRPPKPYAWILEELKELPAFGADTVFVEEFREDLERLGISHKLMVPEEGTISCYIDAVELKAGASSYSGRLVPVDPCDPLAGFPFRVPHV